MGSFFCMLRADVGIGPYGVLPFLFVGGDAHIAPHGERNRYGKHL